MTELRSEIFWNEGKSSQMVQLNFGIWTWLKLRKCIEGIFDQSEKCALIVLLVALSFSAILFYSNMFGSVRFRSVQNRSPTTRVHHNWHLLLNLTNFENGFSSLFQRPQPVLVESRTFSKIHQKLNYFIIHSNYNSSYNFILVGCLIR